MVNRRAQSKAIDHVHGRRERGVQKPKCLQERPTIPDPSKQGTCTCRLPHSDADIGCRDIMYSNNMSSARTVWAFLLGKTSGPRRLKVHRSGNETFNIRPSDSLFTPGNVIYSMRVRAGVRQYHVFFDKHSHEFDRENAGYIFVGVGMNGSPIDICPEDEMLGIMQALRQCVGDSSTYRTRRCS
ncbi:hypothetical protein EDD16DRAFT_1021695 [Pisolithus croceorrhizus]|nr:hypothetical protein EDD16DRAFT_1021695 [Pisolithus croceorrhizus]